MVVGGEAHLVGSRVEPLEGSQLDLGSRPKGRQLGAIYQEWCDGVPAELRVASLGGLLCEGPGAGLMLSAFPPSGVIGVWRLWPGETRHSLKDTPTPPLLPSFILPCFLPLPSSFLLSSPTLLSPPFTVRKGHARRARSACHGSGRG